MMGFGAGIVVTRIRRRLIHDPYSGADTLSDWQSADRLRVGPCAFASSTLYAPSRSDFDVLDRVEVGGAVWEVEGTPAEWQSPYSGREYGVVVSLRRVRG